MRERICNARNHKVLIRNQSCLSAVPPNMTFIKNKEKKVLKFRKFRSVPSDKPRMFYRVLRSSVSAASEGHCSKARSRKKCWPRAGVGSEFLVQTPPPRGFAETPAESGPAYFLIRRIVTAMSYLLYVLPSIDSMMIDSMILMLAELLRQGSNL